MRLEDDDDDDDDGDEDDDNDDDESQHSSSTDSMNGDEEDDVYGGEDGEPVGHSGLTFKMGQQLTFTYQGPSKPRCVNPVCCRLWRETPINPRSNPISTEDRTHLRSSQTSPSSSLRNTLSTLQYS